MTVTTSDDGASSPAPHPTVARTPVTVVTGGPGPVLLPELLDGKDVVVIHDGSDRIGMPKGHAIAIEPEVVALSQDCSRCAVRLDLIRVVQALAGRRRPPDRIVVVSTALAVLIQTFLIDPGLYRRSFVDRIVFVTDAVALGTQLAVTGGFQESPERFDQLAMADEIVLANLDRLTRPAADELVSAVQNRSRFATSSTIAACGNDGCGTFHLPSIEQRWLDHRQPDMQHRSGTYSFLRATIDGWLDRDRLDNWLEVLTAGDEGEMLRVRAVFAVAGEDRPWVAQGCRSVIDLDDGTHRWDDLQANGQPAATQLELIGRDIDPAAVRDSLATCIA